jgi:hypothetical protein
MSVGGVTTGALTRTNGFKPRNMARIFAMERLIKQLVDLNHRMLDTSRLASSQFTRGSAS